VELSLDTLKRLLGERKVKKMEDDALVVSKELATRNELGAGKHTWQF
jgi:hypothetical protein